MQMQPLAPVIRYSGYDGHAVPVIGVRLQLAEAQLAADEETCLRSGLSVSYIGKGRHGDLSQMISHHNHDQRASL